MLISEKAVTPLSKIICGDTFGPYLQRWKLIEYFNNLGCGDEPEIFPTRYRYVEERLRAINGTNKLAEAIEARLDPRDYIDTSWDPAQVANEITKVIKYDGYEVVQQGDFFKVKLRNSGVVIGETIDVVSHDFIREQIQKCNDKLTSGDYNGAITNSRSLVEAIFIEIIERSEKVQFKNDGNFLNLWGRVKKNLRMDIDKESEPDFVYKIVSGIDTSLNGLAALSNNASDRHANKFRTRLHHAKLAVNLATTICDFLVSVWIIKYGEKS